MVKKVGKYELGRSLGEGTFGKVKYAVDTETNEAVAIKILDKEKIQQQNMGNQIKKEISIMKMVKHKYIVEMIEVLASKTKIFIVLELVTGGELFDKIVQVGKLSVEQARFYFLQLVEGVEYCHKLGVCHRDLKPENLLLDEHGNLKISDFGLSSLYIGDSDGEQNRTQLLHTTCGTPNYVAPEVLSDQGYDGKKADVWSIGVILYVLVAGFLPFDESTIVALFAKIQNADFTYPSWFDETIRSLLDKMLVADPKARLSLSELRLHPWCTNGATISLGGEVASGKAGAVGSNGKKEAYDLDSAFQNHHIDDEENDEGDQQQHDVTALNAFDLVSQCGGFMLNKMFSPDFFYTVTNPSLLSGDPSLSRTGKAGAGEAVSSPSGKVLFGSSRFTQKSKCFHFTSSTTSPQVLIGAIYDALKEMSFEFTMSKNTIIHSGSLKGSRISPKGMVGMFVQVFVISPSLNLLEIQKGKGDILEWSNAFSELTEKRIAHLINISPDST